MKHILLSIALLAPLPLAAQHGPAPSAPPRTYSVAPVPAQRVPLWRADLRQLVAELERIHPAPYGVRSRAQISAAVTALDTRIPQLAEHEIIVEFERIIAMVGDGHTNLNLAAAAGVDFHQLPIRFGMYEDGIYVEGADAAYRDAVGGKVVAFNGVSADTALARVRPLISRDNENWIPAAAPHLLNLIEVLHALRLSEDLAQVRLTVERDGSRRDVIVRPLTQTRPRAFGYPFRPQYTHDWVDARPATGLPVTLQPFDRIHDWTYVPAQRLLYIRWDQVQNRSQSETALATFRTALAFARDSARLIDRVLLDLRNNTGGEGGLLDPIVREIVRTREADEPGRFFVAIGARTFSAALLMSVALERYARPIFVGEPTGGKVNVHAGHEFAVLEHSGIGIAISPAYYQANFPQDTRDAVLPRIYTRPTFADYRAGRDPVLDEVLSYQPSRIAAEIEPVLARGDTIAAERMLRAGASDPRNRFSPLTTDVNALGYRFLRAGNTEAALRTFRLNVRVHPDYANGWDSLGEAYEQAGRLADAIAAFERVVALEPENGRAREILARLRAHAR